MTHPERSVHLEVEQVVGFIEGRLEASERTRVEAHLADCADCTSEIVSARRLARPAAHPKRRLAGIVSAAAAAGLLLSWSVRAIALRPAAAAAWTTSAGERAPSEAVECMCRSPRAPLPPDRAAAPSAAAMLTGCSRPPATSRSAARPRTSAGDHRR